MSIGAMKDQKLKMRKIHLHERVRARWQGGRDFYNGEVTTISDTRTKTYTIKYDDGDIDEGVHTDLLRPALSRLVHTGLVVTLKRTDKKK